eukprot:1195688-Prorocentrum_minimum.AAC.4
MFPYFFPTRCFGTFFPPDVSVSANLGLLCVACEGTGGSHGYRSDGCPRAWLRRVRHARSHVRGGGHTHTANARGGLGHTTRSPRGVLRRLRPGDETLRLGHTTRRRNPKTRSYDQATKP